MKGSKAFDAAAKVLNGAEKGGKKGKLKLHEIRLRPGHKKGAIATHHMRNDGGDYQEEQHEFPLASKKELLKHLEDHWPEEAAEMAAEKKGGASAAEPGEDA